MAVAALTLLAASAVHAGLVGPIDPFPGAAAPEAVIAAVLGIAVVVSLVSRSGGRGTAIGAVVFAVLGTAYGLTITVPRGEVGDIAYHLALLAPLLLTTVILIRGREPSGLA